MAKISPSKELKDGKTKKVVSKKLDFLLDTIDTEVANLADVVNLDGPILDEKKSKGDRGAISLSDGGRGMDSLELDMDFFNEPEKPPAEEKSADKEGAKAALDAMSDAEGEVEAMLSGEEASGKPAVAPANVADKEKVDSDLAKALDELLATREVDASKLLENTEKQKVVKSKEPEVEKAQTVEDKLPEELFDDLDKDLELVLEGVAAEDQAASEKELTEDLLADLDEDLELQRGAAATKNQAGSDRELEEDLLGDLEMDVAAERVDESATKEAAIEAGISKDLFETTEQNIAVEEKAESVAGGVTSTSNSDEELANLLSKKIELLVNRLVEERLAEIAERVIMEKINKIFKSMK
jgi:hypothetical protein